MGINYIGFELCRLRLGAAAAQEIKFIFIIQKGCERMTYLEVVFPYSSPPGESEMCAVDSMREVYGIQRVRFNEKERTVRVSFDASRMKQDAVAKLLRQAGIDLRDAVAMTE